MNTLKKLNLKAKLAMINEIIEVLKDMKKELNLEIKLEKEYEDAHKQT